MIPDTLPFRARIIPALLAAALLAGGCKKETETITVEVPAQTAWQEVKTLRNTERIVLGMSQNGSSVFLVQPGGFTTLTGTARRSQGIYQNNALPTDLRVRAGLSRSLFATLVSDSVLAVFRTDYPVGAAGAYLRVNRLDPTILRFNKEYPAFFPTVAINDNNYLLAGYYNAAAPQAPVNFVLAPAELGPTPSAGPVLRPARRVTLPMPAGTTYASLMGLYAIDNYFLVSLLPGGVYKIYENGSYRRVSDEWASRAIYKWQGKLYMLGRAAQVSTDNGESWQPAGNVPTELADSKPFVVGDSLVCAVGDELVSWRQLPTSVRIRVLNNEGLERSTITGVQLLRDTVYVGTTNGLFARPVSRFFENSGR